MFRFREGPQFPTVSFYPEMAKAHPTRTPRTLSESGPPRHRHKTLALHNVLEGPRRSAAWGSKRRSILRPSIIRAFRLVRASFFATATGEPQDLPRFVPTSSTTETLDRIKDLSCRSARFVTHDARIRFDRFIFCLQDRCVHFRAGAGGGTF